ncbi:MAG TPA: hypothetical protein DC047_16870 [Blastocatellia bacterium]|nr:hypothetical protein [Blastocatellia bacterium]
MSTAINTLLVSSPDVCGGLLRIDGTRITVLQIAVLYKQGYSAERIADEYPHLTMAQVYAALAHYHANQEEIEADLEAERKETNGQTNAHTDSLEKEIWLEAFKALQRNLGLTPAKAAEWQDAVREARR